MLTFGTRSAGTSALWLLQNLQVVVKAPTIAGYPRNRHYLPHSRRWCRWTKCRDHVVAWYTVLGDIVGYQPSGSKPQPKDTE